MRVRLLRRFGQHPALSTVDKRESEAEWLIARGMAERAPASSGGSAPASPAPSSEAPSDGRTLAELRAVAEQRGLATYGTKAQLAARIADDAADEDDADEVDDDE